MCGRFTLTRSGREIRDTFDLDATPEVAPRYNIAPTQESLVVRSPAAAGGRRAESARWGFGGGGERRLLINARAETVGEKPSFRDGFARRRCLVPADGFYEWRKEGGRRRRGHRRPFHFAADDGGLLAFGGLWRSTRERLAAAPEAGLAFTILTVPANEVVARVHPRMPLILPAEAWAAWLDAATPRPALDSLLVPYPGAGMRAREVSTAVNDAAHDSPACWAPPEPPPAVQLDLLT